MLILGAYDVGSRGRAAKAGFFPGMTSLAMYHMPKNWSLLLIYDFLITYEHRFVNVQFIIGNLDINKL